MKLSKTQLVEFLANHGFDEHSNPLPSIIKNSKQNNHREFWQSVRNHINASVPKDTEVQVAPPTVSLRCPKCGFDDFGKVENLNGLELAKKNYGSKPAPMPTHCSSKGGKL